MIGNCNGNIVMNKHSTHLDLLPLSWSGWLIGLKNSPIRCWFWRDSALSRCFFPSRWRLTSFSPWCSQLIKHRQIVHLNLYFVAGWIQGHFLVQSELNLVGYLAAPSSFRVLVGGGPSSCSLSKSLPLFSLSVSLWLISIVSTSYTDLALSTMSHVASTCVCTCTMH